jgi:hypothetical protein
MPYSITTRDGITLNNIPDEVPADSPELKQRVQAIRSQMGGGADLQQPPAPAAPQPAPKPDDPGVLGALGIGAGKTVDSVLDGLTQWWLASRGEQSALGGLKQHVDEKQRLYAPLQGQHPIATAVGEALPSMAIPAGGGASLAGTAARLAAAGAVPGALEYGTAGERAARAAGGAAAGVVGGVVVPKLASAAVKAVPAIGRTARAVVEPLTAGGRQNIAGRTLNNAAGDSAQQVIQRLDQAAPLLPGSMPTVAQAAESGGLAALERTISAKAPEEFTKRGMDQASARLQAVRGIAGDDASRAAAVEARATATDPLYAQATGANYTLDPRLERLLQTPIMQQAMGRAKTLAENQQRPFLLDLERAPVMRTTQVPFGPAAPGEAPVMRTVQQPWGAPKSAPRAGGEGVPAKAAYSPSGTVSRTINARSTHIGEGAPRAAAYDPSGVVSRTINATSEHVGEGVGRARPRQITGQGLQDLKMAIDEMLSDPTTGFTGKSGDAVRQVRAQLLNWMEDANPAYRQARTTFADMSKPINQMDVGQALLAKIEPALADYGALGKESAAKYALALRNADQTARQATKFKGAGMADVMTPEQMHTLGAVAQDLARKANAQDLGRGVGSDTFQKLAVDNIAARSGAPRVVGAALNMPGVSKVAKFLYSQPEEQIQSLLAQALLDPKMAAGLMRRAPAMPPGQTAAQALLANPSRAAQLTGGAAGLSLGNLFGQ